MLSATGISWPRRLASRVHVEQLVTWGFAAWSVALILRAHLPYIMQPSQQNVDEGYLLAVGQRVLHGRFLPFVDGVAHSGPLFLYSGSLIAAFGEFSWLPIRIASALAFTANTVLIAACGWRAGRPLAGAIGAFAIPLYCVLRISPVDGISYNAELPATVNALACLLCIVRLDDASRSPTRGWAASAGLFAGLGALSKQICAPLVVPLALYLFAALWTRSELSLAERRELLLASLAGFATPFFLLLSWYAIGGGLQDLYYYVVTYNRGIYMHYYQDVSRLEFYRDWILARPLELAIAAGALGWGLAQLFAARGREASWLHAYQRSALPVTLSLLSVLSIIGARASMRNFDHYYILAVPWLGLLAGLLVESAGLAAPARSSSLKLAYYAAILLPLVFLGEAAWARKGQNPMTWSAQRGGMTDLATARRDPAACAFVRAHSRPDERLFVWGFRPELYITCGRLPASRYVFTTFPSGFVPWHWETSKEQEDTMVVPGSRELLIADLEATKPPILIDGAASIRGRSFARYEPFASYLRQHYRKAAVVAGDDIYLRSGAP